MKDIKSKVMTDLFIAPITVIPGLTGATSFALGFAIGSSTLMFLGLCGVLVAMGGAAWRFMFNMNEVAEQAAKYLEAQKMLQEQARLDDLDEKLTKDRDPRDQNYLRDLRTIYGNFTKDVNEDNIGVYVTSKMIADINAIFDQCIALLEYSYELWESSRELSDSTKAEVLRNREEILSNVEKSVISFTETINGIRALKLQDKKEEATDMQRRLATQLKVAENTQREMRNLNTQSHLSEFMNFQPEAR